MAEQNWTLLQSITCLGGHTLITCNENPDPDQRVVVLCACLCKFPVMAHSFLKDWAFLKWRKRRTTGNYLTIPYQLVTARNGCHCWDKPAQKKPMKSSHRYTFCPSRPEHPTHLWMEEDLGAEEAFVADKDQGGGKEGSTATKPGREGQGSTPHNHNHPRNTSASKVGVYSVSVSFAASQWKR